MGGRGLMAIIKNTSIGLIKLFMKDVYSEYLQSLEVIWKKEIQSKPNSSVKKQEPPFPDPAVFDKIQQLRNMQKEPDEQAFIEIIKWIESDRTLFALFIKYKCTLFSLEALLFKYEDTELMDYVSCKDFLNAKKELIDFKDNDK